MNNKFLKGHWLGHKETVGVLNGFVEVSEKLDGGNSSVKLDVYGNLIARSRNNELIGEYANNKMFNRMEIYMQDIHSKIPFEDGKIYFGETMKKHTIYYGNETSIPPFIGFAVFDIETETYLEDWYEHFDNRGIPRVDFVMLENPTVDDLSVYLNHKSAWGDAEATAEGIFIKNYDKQQFAKIVIDDFKEKNSKIFGAPTPKLDDTSKIAEMFCTIPRIYKGIYKLRDEYEMPVDMKMMTMLPLEVYDDILNEEFITISRKFNNMSFKALRKIVSSKCAITLKDFMLDQMSNKEE